jgi:hypothetical protein
MVVPILLVEVILQMHLLVLLEEVEAVIVLLVHLLFKPQAAAVLEVILVQVVTVALVHLGVIHQLLDQEHPERAVVAGVAPGLMRSLT